MSKDNKKYKLMPLFPSFFKQSRCLSPSFIFRHLLCVFLLCNITLSSYTFFKYTQILRFTSVIKIYDKEFNQYIATIKTPHDLAKKLETDFSYKMHNKIKTTLQFFKDKSGVCRDFAPFAAYILNKLKYQSIYTIILRYLDNTAHMITIFKEKTGMFSIFSNQTYIQTKYNNRYEAVVYYETVSLKQAQSKEFREWD